jgi:hypothetical protein
VGPHLTLLPQLLLLCAGSSSCCCCCCGFHRCHNLLSQLLLCEMEGPFAPCGPAAQLLLFHLLLPLLLTP